MPKKRPEGFGGYSKESSSRVKQLKMHLKGIQDSEEKMRIILSIFSDTELIPEVGKYYTFLYTAKTPGIIYDQHPLIATVSVEKWGFKGLNFHWGTVRNYTWEEMPDKLHVIKPSEISALRSIDYAKIRVR